MRLFDPLYGEIQLPSWLVEIAQSPEVQRLREIRLINTSTKSMPALSDAKRYTHTMGVVHLALENGSKLRQRYGDSSFRTIAVAGLLHDIGTAPFGHLFEYLLKQEHGWTHTGALAETLAGAHHDLGKESQMFAGLRPQLASLLKGAGIDTGALIDAVTGKGPLSEPISARLDFDNIDNVFRMAQALGVRFDRDEPIRIAAAYSDYLCSRNPAGLIASVEAWQATRSAVYNMLAFDPSTVGSQAILSEALRVALGEGVLDKNSWILSDEQLVSTLLSHKSTYELTRRFQRGADPHLLGFLWFDESRPEPDIRERQLATELNQVISLDVGFPVLAYTFIDKSSFGRAIEIDGPNGEKHSIGSSTQSTVVGLFSLRGSSPSNRSKGRAANAALDALEEFGLCRSNIREHHGAKSLFDGQVV